MLKPEKMQKVRVIGLRRDEPGVISLLHELGLLEIRGVKSELAEREKPLDVYRIVSEQLTRVRGMRQALVPSERKKPKPISLEQAISECGKIGIDTKLKLLEEEREEIEKRADEILEEHKALRKIRFLEVDFGKFNAESLDYFVGLVGRKKHPALRAAVRGKASMACSQAQGGFACAVCAPKKEGIGPAIEKAGFKALTLPKMSGTPRENLQRLEEEAETLRERLERINDDYLELSEQNWDRLDTIHGALKTWEGRCEKVSSFATTKETFIAEGWCLEKDFHRLESSLLREFPRRMHVKRISGTDEPPTMLSNPKPLAPFEFLVEFFSLPKAWEIDPSSLLAFTFPIIYGMMVGDVGYGLISLALAGTIIAITKKGMLQGFAKLWAIASIPSILFGILFDEWFGFTFKAFMAEFGISVSGTFLQAFFGSSAHLSRLHDIGILILITVLIGVLHLSMGLLLGFFNEWKHSKWHALAKLAWIGMLFSGLLLIPHLMFNTSLLNLPTDELSAGWALFVISLLIILKVDGIMGVFEIPGIAGNALSYARIAAVGIAGVVVAEAIINKLIFEEIALPNKGSLIIFALLTGLVFILHVLNTFLAMFESLVQGARLNLVEFYGKFFHGGGKKFSPFAMEAEEG